MLKQTAVPINRRALIARINRALAARDEQVIISRGALAKDAVGNYWIRDNKRNCVVKRHIDLEAFGRKIGVLRQWEVFIGDGH